MSSGGILWVGRTLNGALNFGMDTFELLVLFAVVVGLFLSHRPDAGRSLYLKLSSFFGGALRAEIWDGHKVFVERRCLDGCLNRGCIAVLLNDPLEENRLFQILPKRFFDYFPQWMTSLCSKLNSFTTGDARFDASFQVLTSYDLLDHRRQELKQFISLNVVRERLFQLQSEQAIGLLADRKLVGLIIRDESDSTERWIEENRVPVLDALVAFRQLLETAPRGAGQ